MIGKRTAFSSRVAGKAAAIATAAATLSGCAEISESLTSQPFMNSQPQVAPVTVTNQRLRQIPAPSSRVSVAVYSFQDLTGQYKEARVYQQLSTAVTQGGTPILIKALQDAGDRRWFTVLERSNLSDLLKERQIVTEMRRLYREEEEIDPNVLPPLKHASIIIEGGIIGFNSNIATGGAGARYLGIGGNTEYSQDEITVALRAVSTKTGEVLASVTARKLVASVKLQAGVFRYVKMDELLELEAGVANNEPRQIAVESAIEKGVEALILEGVELGIWKFQNPSAGERYVRELKEAEYRNLEVAASSKPARPETRNATYIVATVPAAKPVEAATETQQPQRDLPPARSGSEPAAG